MKADVHQTEASPSWNILLFSRYDRLGASTRLRALQYLPFLEENGFRVKKSPFFSDAYVEVFNAGRPRWWEVFKGYTRRLKAIFWVGKYDLLWIEKELFPYLPATVERLFAFFKMPYVVDYDDATFHHYDCHRLWPVRALFRRKIDVVMRCAAVVVAGNPYLAERAKMAGAKRVVVIPTVVDITRYSTQIEKKDDILIGWIGSRSTTPYLCQILPVLEDVRRKTTRPVRICAIGASREMLRDSSIEVVDWAEETEAGCIAQLDVGIMPLPDSPWERGKCGYKLIQYMACGVAVVASPVGVNREIVTPGENGYLANTPEEWRRALSLLVEQDDLRRKMGDCGREQVLKKYTLQVQAPRLAKLLREIIHGMAEK